MKLARCITLILACLCAGFGQRAHAHLLAPALLELAQTTVPGEYAVHWRASALTAQRQALSPHLPKTCTAMTPPQSPQAAADVAAIDLQWIVRCTPAGLAGTTISVDGLAGSGVEVIVRITVMPSAPVRALLDETHPAFTIAAQPGTRALFADYFRLGLEHLLGGLDHLLFLLGLLLLARGGTRALIATVTAFTIGHSVTLSLAATGLIQVPQALAELAVAITIVLLAWRLVPQTGVPITVRARDKPWIMAFAFGLLHGLGFAGALLDIGLPRSDLPLSLFAFNVGIEAAQLAAIGVVLGPLSLLRRMTPDATKMMQTLRWTAAYGIGVLAMLWCFERAALLMA